MGFSMEIPSLAFASFSGLIYLSRLLVRRVIVAFTMEVTRVPLRVAMEINSRCGPFPPQNLLRGGYRAPFGIRWRVPEARPQANFFKQTHPDSQGDFTWISNGTHNIPTVTRPSIKYARIFSRIKLELFPTLSQRFLSQNQLLVRLSGGAHTTSPYQAVPVTLLQ